MRVMVTREDNYGRLKLEGKLGLERTFNRISVSVQAMFVTYLGSKYNSKTRF